MARDVSVLFARSDSCYFEIVGDVWDAERDARGYSGGNAVIAHPPCRGWGRLSHISVASDDEKALGLFAVDQVRRCGGVLEHPWASKLWKAAGLPKPSDGVDQWGGFTVLLDQGWFGHAAPKPTWLYVCGIEKKDMPALPVKLHRAGGRTLDLPVAQREATPVEFAKWLVSIAGRCNRPLPGQCNKGAVTSSDRVVTRTWCEPGMSNSDPVTCGQSTVTRAHGESNKGAAVTRGRRRVSYLDFENLLIG